jgi:hypothetical protein
MFSKKWKQVIVKGGLKNLMFSLTLKLSVSICFQKKEQVFVKGVLNIKLFVNLLLSAPKLVCIPALSLLGIEPSFPG